MSKNLPAIGKYSNPTVPFSLEAWVEDVRNGVPPPVDLNANATEDCLLLDVHVPKKILEGAQTKQDGSPVLVLVSRCQWLFLFSRFTLTCGPNQIHGGGGVFGSKDGSGPTLFEPSGILKQSRDKFGEEFVCVRLNYRLGAFGFLAGSEVLGDGNANAGLLDQCFALERIRDNIHLFGGDKSRVTVMGGLEMRLIYFITSLPLNMARLAANSRSYSTRPSCKVQQTLHHA